MKGVWFGNKHSYYDFNLVLTRKELGSAEAKVIEIEIPAADGTLDLTEALTGDVKYANRTITLAFTCLTDRRKWMKVHSDLSNYINGQKMKVILDEEPSFFYVARLKVNELTVEEKVGEIIVEGTADAYKYDVSASNEDWYWDDLDFETGIINDTKEIKINGSRDLIIIGRRKKICPVIVVDSLMEVTFNGSTYQLKEGRNIVLGVVISEGENVLHFSGNGVITVEYRGGSL